MGALKNLSLTVLGAALIALGAGNQARAASLTFTEIKDAGETLNTASTVRSGVTKISGEIARIGDVDLYKISLLAGLFRASTVGGTAADTQLFLFDSVGKGVFGNDDDGDFLQSTVSGNLSAGIYYLAVTAFNSDPFSDLGPIFPDNIDMGGEAMWGATGLGGEGILSSWAPTPVAETQQTGDYTVFLSSEPVPEPVTVLGSLVGFGFLGAGRSRQRRQQPQKAKNISANWLPSRVDKGRDFFQGMPSPLLWVRRGG